MNASLARLCIALVLFAPGIASAEDTAPARADAAALKTVLVSGSSAAARKRVAIKVAKRRGKANVYRVAVGDVLNKYIGETEKNLARVLAVAERKDWLLFFDEADALFGKRTSVRDAHDRYANQEVSYLRAWLEKRADIVVLGARRTPKLSWTSVTLRSNVSAAALKTLIPAKD